MMYHVFHDDAKNTSKATSKGSALSVMYTRVIVNATFIIRLLAEKPDILKGAIE